MHMIINNQSMVPIYEQIMEQIKKAIASGELSEGSMLPSVRGLAAELRISALTVKKAYDRLEEEGLTVTVHGKGTFVTETNRELVKEQQRMMAEQELQKVVEKALRGGLTKQELRDLFEMIMEEFLKWRWGWSERMAER